ncbi:MAG TPA: glycyl-radical enzyme activating protein [Methylomusa anaerophila]|uniref:Benzylsuccinate synthase activating enzyme n=1 Tax=Methylomusa anaerophila TaxID=1930071 RepID=A0A348AJ88_9FIRM|nr:glycyl-radical enzyme activating protein [Methylomusa anaerophila]BBB91136.1 benzylsuccinate synthase activating enzyme [Methylomusa anaerophila]HML89012.1 glycyl-radical enzyme activating protein [Methylomusa anaerophila]
MEANHQHAGYVFNIQQFSVHDGPGIRTMVFLKGCPLRCRWCSNPESQDTRPELAYNPNKCIGLAACGSCLKACPHKAIRPADNDKPAVDREVCRRCFNCTTACPTTALHTFGQLMTVDDILAVVESDNVFYSRSGGGLTVSGGEPLLQGDFTLALLKEAKRRRLNTAMETSGYAHWQTLAEACRYLNTLIYDIKCLDAGRHRTHTRLPNQLILENFNKVTAAFPDLPVLVRTPVIPGFNDTEADIAAISDFLKGRAGVSYELLPYHRLGQQKYEFLGIEYPLGGTSLNEATLARLQAVKNQKQY